MFVDEKALRFEWMRELKKTYPGQTADKKAISQVENLKFWIQSISPKGHVIIKFSEPVFEFDKLNTREIDVKLCSDKKCNEDDAIEAEEDLRKKRWVQVDVVAGEDSNASKLGFESDIFFTDS